MKLTFFGDGVMSKAIITPLVKSGYEIEVFGRNEQKLEKLKKELKDKIDVFVYGKDNMVDIKDKIVILCIKPYALDEVSSFIKHGSQAKVLISILASTSLDNLKNKIQALSYIKAMPNIAACYQKSMTTLMGDINSKELAIKIMSSVGQTLWVETQKEFDIATILAASAPAFLALVSEALIDGAVKEGLKRDDASFLTKGLFAGFSELLKQYPHPAIIKDDVMSPGGITAKGYAKLEEGKVRDSFIKVFLV